MKFSFKHYQFDSQEQLLTKNGSIVRLNEKPAQLLSLLVLEPEKIHSKSDILEKVWPNRVVTDQVVFQNISHLRALFGDEAIRTFSKKGYQWQLPLEKIAQPSKPISKLENVNDVNSDDLAKPQKTESTHSGRFTTNYKVILASAVLVLTLFLFKVLMNNEHKPNADALSQHNDNLVYAITVNNAQPSMEPPDTQFSGQKLFDSPFSSWQKYAVSTNQWLLATKSYQVDKAMVLRFQLQGEKRGWHGYIEAADEQLAHKNLQQFLQLLAQSNYFSSNSNHSALAELTILLSKQPENKLLIQQLIEENFKLDELDRATALINQQMKGEQSTLQLGLLNLLKTRINQWNRKWLVAEQSAEQALLLFEQLGITHLQSAAFVESAWVHLVNENFRTGMQALNQAASLARGSKEPLQEVNAHLIQSFMASKAGQTELMHNQLDLAQQLIALHHLGEEHMVPVYTNLGWMANSLIASLPHYQKILAMPFSMQYQQDFYVAAEKVCQGLIAQQAWQQTNNCIKDWQRASFKSLNRALFAFAQQDWRLGVELGLLAFQQAQVEHNKTDALDAALLLLRYQEHADQEFDVKEVEEYIKQKASRRWLSQNPSALAKIK